MDLQPFIDAVSDVSLHYPSVGVIIASILTIMLLVGSALASGSEIAFFSLSPTDMAELEASKSAKDVKIKMLREDSERTLATILITNNFVNVTIIMLTNYIFNQIISFGPKAYILQFLLITILLTFLLLLFGEIMPKVFSRQNPLGFCRRIITIIYTLRFVFWPIENILLKSGVLISSIIQKDNHLLSMDELEQALELTKNEEIKEEKHILEGIIRFGDETAKEIMTSRQDIVYLNINSNFKEVIDCIRENNYSRVPVCQDNTDNIKGILYIKDLLPHIAKPIGFKWQSLIRPAYFVPETKKIDDLLKDFQENKIHIAIVVDEFGGTCGLVTLEDVLEEIVGEINDEYDDDDQPFIKLNANTYIFEGKTLLSDVFKVLHADEDDFADITGEIETLAGLVLELKGDFPTAHEIIEYKNYSFEVLTIADHRINKVKVTIGNK